MELRTWALRVFTADTLEEKLFFPGEITDREPGRAVAWRQPPRPPGLRVAGKGKRLKFPHPSSLDRQDMRIRCLHTFANHELMALEMMAWALLAFPEADPGFRRGLANILRDEQRHFQLYAERLEAMGTRFGELPLNDHFWRVANEIASPLDWICTMHLTFEQANLDHAPYYARLFHQVEDQASAQLMEVIFQDELGHVGFGAHWLKHYKPAEQSLFEAFTQHSTSHNSPLRARGPEFQEAARLKAGLDQDFVQRLCRYE